MRAVLSARVSTKEQNTLPVQMKAVKSLVRQQKWTVTMAVSEIASGRATRPELETIMKAARQRKLDVVVVWKVDRWGHNLSDLISSIEELSMLGVSLVSATESFDMTSPAGRAMVSILSVFFKFRKRYAW